MEAKPTASQCQVLFFDILTSVHLGWTSDPTNSMLSSHFQMEQESNRELKRSINAYSISLYTILESNTGLKFKLIILHY